MDGILTIMVTAPESRRPLRVGFLLIDGFALMSFAAASEPLRAANLLARRPLYDVRHLAAAGEHAVLGCHRCEVGGGGQRRQIHGSPQPRTVLDTCATA